MDDRGVYIYIYILDVQNIMGNNRICPSYV